MAGFIMAEMVHYYFVKVESIDVIASPALDGRSNLYLAPQFITGLSLFLAPCTAGGFPLCLAVAGTATNLFSPQACPERSRRVYWGF